MKLKSPMLVVTDLERSKAFCKTVLRLRVFKNFSANITLTDGLALQDQGKRVGIYRGEGNSVPRKRCGGLF